MKKLSLRETTLNKIAKSVEEAWTLEQLLSTEQFLLLYYSRFAFECSYLRAEWQIDSHLQEKKQLLTALEGAQSYVPNPRKRSLQRMEMYVKTLFQKEFQTEWAQLQIQLVDVTPEELQLYPAVCERAATIKTHASFLARMREFA